MQHRHPENEELEAPPKLITALRQLPVERIFIPPAMDDAVLAAARRHLAKPDRRWFNWFHVLRWAAAAAVVVLFASLIYVLTRPPSFQNRQSTFAREDINHDGRVDILDAFALARQIKAGAPLDRRFDLNGDGVVDERDVKAIAARAVTLEKRGRA